MKNTALDGLRGLACLNVVFAHFLFSFFPYLAHGQYVAALDMKPAASWQEWFGKAPFTLLYNGNFPVVIFFILSGYVLSIKYWNTSDESSLILGAIKRYPRLIFPAAGAVFFVVMICYLGLMHSQDRPGEQFAGWIRAMYASPIAAWPTIYSIFIGVPFIGTDEHVMLDAPLWTLHIEFVASVALLLTFRLVSPRKWLGLALYTMLCFTTRSPIFYLSFALGAAICSLSSMVDAHPKWAPIMLLIGLGFGAFDYTNSFSYLASIPLPHCELIHVNLNSDKRSFWNMLGGSFLLVGVLGSKRIASMLMSRIVQYYGKLSFSIYLLHWPIQLSFTIWAAKFLTDRGCNYSVAAFASFAVSIIVVTLCSDVFYRFVDLPSSRFGISVAFRFHYLCRDLLPIGKRRKTYDDTGEE